jgi:hypothetical protein
VRRWKAAGTLPLPISTGSQPLFFSIPSALPGTTPFLGAGEVALGEVGSGAPFLGSSAAGRRERG